ncbi:MAG: fumarate reductase/succinate dehydrogenase flavoprotein subunit [Deltaproteobacteria bacterium]|nr:fumarate reductase/succinate dehydrogenase flavoprotein subunit [Deltaproteobacteria bacterium]
MTNFQIKEQDVLVIGAGGAGLRASIEAAAQGASVGLVCKSLLGKAHTVMAEGGMAAALRNVDERDSWKVHFRDTMRGGKMLSHWRMAQIHAQEAPDRVKELEGWGALFDRTKDGKILQRNFGGHQYPRLAHVGDRTGLELIRTLQDHAIHCGIDVHMECTIYKLFKENGKICGALGYYRTTGEFIFFKAKSVIIATGGIGKSFRVTSNSWEYTGDGQALALETGADLIDMEFIQFHPTGMVWPLSVKGTLVTEGVRGEGGILKNSKGERFMFHYVPDMFKGEFAESEEECKRWLAGDKNARRPPELLTRDVVAKAIHAEVKAGRGSPHGGAFLDIATQRTEEEIKKKLPSMYHQFKELGNIDITKEAMEVGPTCHYIMGGIAVDPETQETSVPGLFAAGECASGLHGANRLGGNSLSDLIVFGRRAGLYAAQHSKKIISSFATPQNEIEQAIHEALEPFERKTGENPFTVMEDLQETMEAHAGIVREEESLVEGLKKLEILKKRVPTVKVDGDRTYNGGWHTALDLKNMVIVSECLARAALARKESRGGHTRIDFPRSEEKFGKLKHILRKRHDTIELVTTPVPEMPDELKKIIEGDVA